MPRGDGTGPNSLGPRTGRNLGYCAGYDTPGYTKGPGRGMAMGRGPGWGQGRGLGYGRGPGMGRGYGRGVGYGAPGYIAAPPVYRPPVYGIPPTASPENQLAMLKQEKDYLGSEMEGIKSALDNISKRIEELEK